MTTLEFNRNFMQLGMVDAADHKLFKTINYSHL